MYVFSLYSYHTLTLYFPGPMYVFSFYLCHILIVYTMFVCLYVCILSFHNVGKRERRREEGINAQFKDRKEEPYDPSPLSLVIKNHLLFYVYVDTEKNI